MRRAAKIDNNQREIVDALRDVPGVSVEPGHDDILVGFRGRTLWFELKSARSVSRRTQQVLESRKQARQKRLDETWTGHRQYATSVDDILACLGVSA